ncbi:Uncharacterized protein FWK35_00014342 [Aphis craccivora]|uniref:Uncharacterized protein n=1 Tax=Aphis craccivora TaxID=307492 RepID=A0A6G0Y7D9_APHCR|nr:Uncharacterized protein FWK35_00014342 [Aphis craccivora]
MYLLCISGFSHAEEVSLGRFVDGYRRSEGSYNDVQYCLIKPLQHFERSDECIDFIIMCVFFIFVSVTTFWSISPVSDRKVNLVGILWNVWKNPKKVTEKREFLRKTSFRPNRLFYMVIIQKLITTTEIFVSIKNLDDQKVPYELFLL